MLMTVFYVDLFQYRSKILQLVPPLRFSAAAAGFRLSQWIIPGRLRLLATV
jgi:hypothetical protein